MKQTLNKCLITPIKKPNQIRPTDINIKKEEKDIIIIKNILLSSMRSRPWG